MVTLKSSLSTTVHRLTTTKAAPSAYQAGPQTAIASAMSYAIFQTASAAILTTPRRVTTPARLSPKRAKTAQVRDTRTQGEFVTDLA